MNSVMHRSAGQRLRPPWTSPRSFVALCVVVACAPTSATPPKKSPDPRPVSVLAAPISHGALPVIREGVGHAAPFLGVTVRPQVDGRLQRVCFAEGDVVRANQILGIIDPRPYTIALETAKAACLRDKASLENARLNLGRYKRLRHEKMVSEQQLTDQESLVSTSEATVLSDEAQLMQAKLQLDYAYVKAPIDGVTGFRGIDPGNVVRASDSNGLVTILQTDPIAVLFSLPQDALADVFAAKQSNEAVVRVYARDANTLLGEGSLALIDNQVQTQTGTIRLKAVLANPNQRLWPNQFLRVALQLRPLPPTWLVPSVSVRSDSSTSVLFVVHGKQARRVPVRVLGGAQGQSAVEGELHEGNLVITDGAAGLKDGATISVQTAPPQTAEAPSR